MSGLPLPNTVIRASAGSGKTFQLSNRYISLLAEGVDCASILASTFTKKAAGEILDRIARRLAEAALDEEKANEIGEYIDQPGMSANDCKNLLFDLMRNLHRVQIGTLDSFFFRLAKSYSLEIGFPTDWKIVAEFTERQISDEAIESVLASGKVAPLFHLLTKGEASRSISRLVRTTVQELYNVYLEAPQEAWQRIPRRKLPDKTQLDIVLDAMRNFDAPNGRMRKAIDGDIEAFEKEDFGEFLSKGLSKKINVGDTTYYKKPIDEDLVANYQSLLEYVKQYKQNEIAGQNEATYDLLKAYDEYYSALKSKLGAARFDDITRRLSVLVGQEAPSDLTYRIDRNVDHLLLDEFQDTAPIQWHVLKPFAAAVSAEDPQKSFFCVGDTKQAIYGWRGGEAEIFDSITEDLKGDIQSLPLAKSYRSSPVIIHLVNKVFQSMRNHNRLDQLEEPVLDWCQRFPEHTTHLQEMPGHVTLETSPHKDISLDYAAEKVAKLYHQCPNQSIGVLVRQNDTLARMIYLLNKMRIPASEEGGAALIDSAAVQVIMSALTLTDHPGNSVARFHVAHSPLAKMFGLKNEIEKSRMNDPKVVAKTTARIRRELLSEGYGPTIQRMAALLLPSCNPREADRLQKVVDLAYSATEHQTLRPAIFVDFIRREKIADPKAARVRVMTIHQAKGLEFDIVVLPELDNNILGQTPNFIADRINPGQPIHTVCKYTGSAGQALLPPHLQKSFQSCERRRVDEAMSVLYVALTRAKNALHMIINPTYNDRLNKSNSGLLRAALTEEAAMPMMTLFESGDPKWAEKVNEAVEPKTPTESGAKKLEIGKRIRVAKLTTDLQRNLERVNPSKLAGGELTSISEFMNYATLQSQSKGTQIHRILESIDWIDQQKLDRSRMLRDFDYLFDDQESAEMVIDELMEYLECPEIHQLMQMQTLQKPELLGFSPVACAKIKSQPVTTDLRKEFRIATTIDEKLISGAVDRVVFFRDAKRVIAADIVEFKTEKIFDDDDLQYRTEFYRPQLDIYRQAIAKSFQLADDFVNARLVFLNGGYTVPIRPEVEMNETARSAS